MREVVTLTGMVLTASTMKEYDKRIELLTRERGRISAFAQGARRPNSSLAACTIPFTFGTYQLYEGRASYTVQSAQIQEYFEPIAQDFDRLCYASYFAEMAQYFTRENVEASQELLLLYLSLKALVREQVPVELIRAVFELRLMQIQGEALEVFHCLKCGKEHKGMGIYLSQGGFVCDDCVARHAALQSERRLVLSDDALYTVQYVMTAPLEKLYTFLVTPAVQRELTRFLKEYLERYLHHDFKSITFLS